MRLAMAVVFDLLVGAAAVLQIVADYRSALLCLWFALILMFLLFHPHFNRRD
jgi:hypothetical protein